jgi:hypothetical protein
MTEISVEGLALLNKIELMLEERGFKRDIQTFYRDSSQTEESLYIHFTHPEIIMIYVGFAFVPIEDLLASILGKRNYPHKWRTTTFLVELGKLTNKKQYHLGLHNEKHAEQVAILIVQEFIEIVLPFFQQFDTLDKVLNALTGVTERDKSLCAVPNECRLRSVVGVYLTQDKRRFEQIIVDAANSINDPYAMEQLLIIVKTLKLSI